MILMHRLCDYQGTKNRKLWKLSIRQFLLLFTVFRPLLIIRFEISGQSSSRLLTADRERPHIRGRASHGVEISFQLNVSSLKMRPICHLNLSVVFVDLKRRERISFQLFSFGSGKLNLFILMRSVFFYPGTNNFE